MRAYSLDLRERVVAALDSGQTYQQVAQRFDLSVPTVGRYRRLKKTQNTLAAKRSPGRKPNLSPQDQEQLSQLFATRADWTLQTLRTAWLEQSGKSISIGSLHGWMHKLGFSYKKRVASPPRETPGRTRNNGQPSKKP